MDTFPVNHILYMDISLKLYKYAKYILIDIFGQELDEIFFV